MLNALQCCRGHKAAETGYFQIALRGPGALQCCRGHKAAETEQQERDIAARMRASMLPRP